MAATRKCPFCGAGWPGTQVAQAHMASCSKRPGNAPTSSAAPQNGASANTQEVRSDFDGMFEQFKANHPELAPAPEPSCATVAVSASALFDTRESDTVFAEQGLDAYREYQDRHADEPLQPGPAMPLIRRLLALNKASGQRAVNIVILSKNDEDSGHRISKALEDMNLDIHDVQFLDGQNPTDRAQDLNVDLMLSANEEDVRHAVAAGLPAGCVQPRTNHELDPGETVLAFDFDGVLADDESEQKFAEGGLKAFESHEKENADVAHNPGPMLAWLRAVNRIQDHERQLAEVDPDYAPMFRTILLTARGGGSAERVHHSLKTWGVRVDQAFFMAGAEKVRALQMIKPAIFMDDQKRHLEGAGEHTTGTHVPFGVRN